MKKLAGFVLSFLLVQLIHAQRNCSSHEYVQRMLETDPTFAQRISEIEQFTHRLTHRTVEVNDLPGSAADQPVLVIPVVVHVVYHYPDENIPDSRIREQIEILNRDFRRLNADTSNIPDGFADLSADIRIEFKLATSDPKGRATSGVVRKYSPLTKWKMDDKVKFDDELGSDAWDASQYLNIWVCNMDDLLGYASFPGTPLERDGIVINYKAFGPIGYFSQYNKGRTTVHEVGHWLNLRHIWGDADCGDDLVGDTPPQRSYTPGCPSGVRVTCNNASNGGDMYMNYMDFTSDACVNMFTYGQKQRMRTLFEEGGPRHSFLNSRGLDDPILEEGSLPDNAPRWLHIKLYPNPANSTVTMNFQYDVRWIGKELRITDLSGRIILRSTISHAIHTVDISRLAPGVYFIDGEKDGEKMREKFIKL